MRSSRTSGPSAAGTLAVLCALCAVLLQPTEAPAQSAGARQLVLPPPPSGTHSLEIINADAPVFLAPRRGATRRGTLARGARFPVGRRIASDGCDSAWAEIAPSTYVCEQHVRYTSARPHTHTHPNMPEGELLPHEYAFVAVDGTRAFARPEDYFTDEYVEAMGAGFGVIVRRHEMHRGVPFARTRRGLYVESDALRRARGSDFGGVAIEPGTPLDIAWVGRRGARMHERRGGRVVRRAGAREVLHVRATERGWTELTDGTFVRTRDIVVAAPAERPEGVAEDGTWIDVDVDAQTAVAYRGDQPVYATLVSTGKNRPSHATPEGVHRLWVKLAFSDMDNLEREDLESNYALERVPWVQYFEGANGLHAAFWHDDFGRRKSHGCVNLAPRDARVLFDFTEPALPPGWTAIFPTPDERTTYVSVR